MKQEERGVDLDRSAGYALKQASSALRAAMDAALRPLDLTVSQYACLEVLGQRPGLSGAELARAVFVSRQSMNLVLRGLQDRGLITRAAVAEHGRTLPMRLTADGATTLRAAGAVVSGVEERMLAAVPDARRRQFRDDLAACAAALGHGVVGASADR